jgi:hypothetical protein
MTPETLRDSALVRAISDLYVDLSDFVQKELRLARAELADTITARLYGGAWMAVAAVLGFIAALLIAEGIVFVIASTGLALYWSCFVVAAGLILDAALSFYYGRASMMSNALATRTTRQLSEAVTTAKEQFR